MIVVIFGTRPEAIKLGPVVAELKALHVPTKIFCTGQHTTLLEGTPAETDLADSISLGMSSNGSVTQWLATVEQPLKTVLRETPQTAVVVVQGDTMSALAGARAAFDLHRELAHVEAGIRSHRLREPWPEEEFRIEIDRLANWHYAPTSNAYANLLAEGLNHTLVTGNTVVSALARYTDGKRWEPMSHIMVTLHRRELVHGKHFPDVVRAIADAATEHPRVLFEWPVHPAVYAHPSAWGFRFPDNLEVTGPLTYRQSIECLSTSLGVLTDSGGLQEEAATLGIPCAVLRNVTDRPESIDAGIARLFSPTSLGVREAITTLCEQKIPREAVNLYGNPDAASRIAQHLETLVHTPAPYYGD